MNKYNQLLDASLPVEYPTIADIELARKRRAIREERRVFAENIARMMPKAKKRKGGCHGAYCSHAKGCLCRCPACKACVKKA